MKKQTCTKCQRPSLPGMAPGGGKCRFHWAQGNWGQAWASRCVPDHPEADRQPAKAAP